MLCLFITQKADRRVKKFAKPALFIEDFEVQIVGIVVQPCMITF